MFSTIPAAVLLKRSTVHETNLGEQDGIEEGHFDQLVQLQLHFEFVLFLLHYESHTAVQDGCLVDGCAIAIYPLGSPLSYRGHLQATYLVQFIRILATD